ncbi:MAG: TrkH family potassium uptake protein [Flavobacteriales bacterium]|nr:TrkH family potassium uptake protein [Flavobacteriales bacterium]
MSFLDENIIRRLRNIRESVNILLYDSKKRATKIMDVMSVAAALLGIAALLFDHGFENSSYNAHVIHITFRCIITFYYVKFVLGYLYSFTPKKYFKDYKVNGILLGIILCVLIYDATSPVWVGELLKNLLDIDDPKLFSILVEQTSFLLLLIIELGRASSFLPAMRMSAQKLFTLSFMILIFVGAGLLMLPRMSVAQYDVSFVDALFTATSASCVTGLSVNEISEVFTLRGQLVIMLLIQFGGLNIITFATFFLILSKKNIGIKNQALIKDSLDAKNFTDSMQLLKEIFVSTFVIESIGAILIFFNWSNNTPFIDFYQKAYFSIFHSISAFNNAGFSLFQNGMMNYYCQNAYVLQFVIALLIILGGIGFPVIKDVFGDVIFKRHGKINRKWSLNTKIVVFTSLCLIFIGMFFFMLFEWNNGLKSHQWGGKIIVSFFQSVSARTAGFSSVDFSMLFNPTLILFIILMFIGASPVSTGGGIKTSTFTILLLSAINTIKGKERIDLEHSQVSNSAVLRSMTILLFSACFVILGTIILSFTQPGEDMMKLVFEEVSAFTTTGLSTGITPNLTTSSKIMLIVSMFMGRIGLLTFGFALISKIKPEPDYHYPKARIVIG